MIGASDVDSMVFYGLTIDTGRITPEEAPHDRMYIKFNGTFSNTRPCAHYLLDQELKTLEYRISWRPCQISSNPTVCPTPSIPRSRYTLSPSSTPIATSRLTS
jgi:hypothetical protein